jgi:hypothetical protein
MVTDAQFPSKYNLDQSSKRLFSRIRSSDAEAVTFLSLPLPPLGVSGSALHLLLVMILLLKVVMQFVRWCHIIIFKKWELFGHDLDNYWERKIVC